MERRLDQFSSRLSSQLCEIEKKMDSFLDRQSEVENTLFGTVVLSI